MTFRTSSIGGPPKGEFGRFRRVPKKILHFSSIQYQYVRPVPVAVLRSDFAARAGDLSKGG